MKSKHQKIEKEANVSIIKVSCKSTSCITKKSGIVKSTSNLENFLVQLNDTKLYANIATLTSVTEMLCLTVQYQMHRWKPTDVEKLSL